MQKELEVLLQDESILVRRLSYRKLLIEYSVPVYLHGIIEPIERVSIKLRYQVDSDFLDSILKTILPVSEVKCQVKTTTYQLPIRSINGRWGIKQQSVNCTKVSDMRLSLNNVDYVLNFFPIEYHIDTEESINRVKTKLREKYLNTILI